MDKELVKKTILEALENPAVDQMSTRNRSSWLRERNKKIQKEMISCKNLKGDCNEETRKLKESMQRQYGIDIFNEKEFPVVESGRPNERFNWKKLSQKLEEADNTSGFTQFLRAGIQAISSAAYDTVETTYEDWVTVIPSGRAEELYTPNHGVSFPREVAEGGKYPEVGVAALDIKLRNKKFGSMFVATKELIEDDQTGSFARQASTLGEYLRYLQEVRAYGKLLSVSSMKYINFEVPTSETKPSDETNYPWASSSAPLIGGGVNRPASYGGLTQGNIQTGISTLMVQKNLQGIRMNVLPTRLLIGPKMKFDAAVLLNSAWYPAGAQAAGVTGGAFAINPIQGLLDISVTRFMPNYDGTFNGDSTAWVLVDDSHPWFVMQIRTPLAVIQENPASGRSFEEDIYRWKANIRLECDHIDPRFAWLGNDGSA